MTYHRLFARARAVAFLMALLLLAATLLSCSAARPIPSTEQELRVVAVCEGYEIHYDELRYLTMTYKDSFAAKYGANVWSDAQSAAEHLPLLQQQIEDALKINYAILSLCADFHISPTDEDIQSAVNDEIEQTIKSVGGRKTYAQMLESMYMTDRFVRFNVETDLCESLLASTLIDMELIIDSQEEFLVYVMDDENLCATFHIFIENDVGEDVEQNRLRAGEVRGKILDGTALTDLIGTGYNEDVYETGTPYHFMRGEYELAYEQAAFALDVGEISDVVECENGFYIIERRPISEAYVMSELFELMQRYQYAEVESLLTEHRQKLSFEWTDYGRSIDLIAMQ